MFWKKLLSYWLAVIVVRVCLPVKIRLHDVPAVKEAMRELIFGGVESKVVLEAREWINLVRLANFGY